MTKDEALKLALWHEAMAREPNRNQAKREKHEATAKFIKESLAQSEQYPQIAINPEIVGYVAPQLKIEGSRHVICQCDKCKAHPEQEPVYTHPAKDLEDIEINITWNENSMRDFGKDELNFARAILRKAKEK